MIKYKSILILFVVFTNFGCEKGESEIILVPDDFSGYILVLFNQQDGKPIKYKGNCRIYEIPKNGILKTKFESNDGWKKYPKFYYRSIDSINKIPSGINYKLNSIPMDTIIGFEGETGSTSTKDNRILFTIFYVGNKSKIVLAKKEVENYLLKIASE